MLETIRGVPSEALEREISAIHELAAYIGSAATNRQRRILDQHFVALMGLLSGLIYRLTRAFTSR